MTTRLLVSPEDQNATFVELFFDLIFVFSVTQVVGVLHHGLDWATVGKALLVFWLVWWAWTQFTWALNAADTTHPVIELTTLVATAVTFFMAISLPDAFGGLAMWFAVPYVLVRLIGLGLYAAVAWSDLAHRAAVLTFSIASFTGLAAVLVGAALGGQTQYWFWALAIAFDVLAALIGARAEGWNLHPEHFAERHGLFVIIALGETLIVTAGGMTGGECTTAVMTTAVLAVAVTCGLWWTYFPQAKPLLEAEFARRRGAQQSRLARDVYSLTHFPMICGIIAFAVAVEDALTHADAALSRTGSTALAIGLVLFVGGMAGAMWRATGRPPIPRIAVTLITAALIVALPGISTTLALSVALLGTAGVAMTEARKHEQSS